jgi:hypothetical protein
MRFQPRNQRIFQQLTIYRWSRVRVCATVEQVKYHEILLMGRPELEALIESGNDSAIIEALLSAAYYDPDWR